MTTLTTLTTVINAVGTIFVIIATPTIAIYLLYDWDRLVAGVNKRLPPENAPLIRRLASHIDDVLTGFVWGQLVVGSMLATFYSTVLMALGLNYGLKGGYSIGDNWAVNEMTQFTPDTPDQYAGFNSPRNRYNVSVGKQVRPGSNWGFSVNFRHQDAFRWESSFVRPTLTTVPYFTNTTVPANRIVDAQFSFRMPVQKTTFKVGGTNIFNTPYVQAYGNPTIGAMYYVGVTFDQLSN